MFGNELTIAQTGVITLLGMGIVFCVLIILVIILELFRFIPKEASSIVSSPSTPSVTASSTPVQNISIDTDVLPLHKAIIMSAILESLGEEKSQYKVRFKRIQKIS